jgi:hypothetical protein
MSNSTVKHLLCGSSHFANSWRKDFTEKHASGTILAADRHISEAGESSHLLTRLKDKKITLPANPDHWPTRQHLEWHRRYRFLGG